MGRDEYGTVGLTAYSRHESAGGLLSPSFFKCGFERLAPRRRAISERR